MNKFCSVRLSTVGIVVGCLHLVGSILSFIILCVEFSSLDDIVQAFIDSMGGKPNIDEDSIRLVIVVGLCVYLTISLVHVVASALLIVGTVKERHLLLTPWLVNTFVIIVFNCIYMLYIWIAYDSFIPPALATRLGLLLQLVIWHAIYSLFKQIRANPRNARNPNYTTL